MKKIFLILVAILAVFIGVFFLFIKSRESKIVTEKPPFTTVPDDTKQSLIFIEGQHDAVLFGRIVNVDDKTEKIIATVELMEEMQGQDAQERAAIIDGVCTTEQVKKNSCLNNPFYLRNLGKDVRGELSSDAVILLYAREPRDGMLVNANDEIYLETTSTKSFIEILNSFDNVLKVTPFYITIHEGKIIKIQEKYIP